MPAAGYNRGWTYWSFVAVLKPYIKNTAIFMCPTGAKKLVNGSDQTNPNAEDGYWTWTIGPPGQTSNYGNNILLGGGNTAGVPDNWVATVPTEAEVHQPTKVIYLVDARWVDLAGGWMPGRIGMARTRHRGGAIAVCCDGHSRWVPVSVLIKWPEAPNAPLVWNYKL
jgi:hypothetical protein